MPHRIIRAYRDHKHEHMLLEALAAPNVALICRETWYYCCKQYLRTTFKPVWYPNSPLDPSPQRAMKPQFTWYCPCIDALYIDHVESVPILRLRQPIGTDAEDQDGSQRQSQSQSVAVWEDNSFVGRSHTLELMEALYPVAKVTETILITINDDDFLTFAMLPGLFPNLKTVLFTAGYDYRFRNDTFAFTHLRAQFTQANCIKGPANAGSRLKLVPLSPSRLLFDGGQFNPRVSDNYTIKTWDTVFSNFSTKGFREGNFGTSQWYKALVERMIAVARYYWNDAYATEEDGSRVYDYYSRWVRSIYPNSPEVVAFLSDLPQIVPVVMYQNPWRKGVTRHGSIRMVWQ
ncbi:hypothetical protein PG991_005529 [Apiospora marii]|uniref:Uncharacterized protein n=1 Tax=Apiospora marii TaxID=335849 RepID=A0ABR1S9K5_9PEZI